jgi:hypothetical protein
VNVFTPLTGTSRPEASYLQLGGRASRTFRSGRLFARPALNATVTQLRQGHFEEEGLGGLGIVGDGHTQTIGALSPEVGLGVMLRDEAESKAALTVTIGGTFRSTDDIEAPFRLAGANPDADPARITTPFGGDGFRYGLDLTAEVTDSLSLRIGYGVETAGGTRAETAGVNARLKF